MHRKVVSICICPYVCIAACHVARHMGLTNQDKPVLKHVALRPVHSTVPKMAAQLSEQGMSHL